MRGIVANAGKIGIGESRPFHPNDYFEAASWKIEPLGRCAIKRFNIFDPGLPLYLKHLSFRG